MTNPNESFRQQRWKQSVSWSATPRVIAALIGAALAQLVPGNPTGLQSAVFIVIKAVGGILVVEAAVFLVRYIWLTPAAMFRALEAKQAVYRASIDGLLADIERLKGQLARRSEDQQFADVLTERYEYGLHEIMNWPVLQKGREFSHEDLAEWNRLEREWTEGVRQLLEEHGCSPQVIAHFWSIHEVPFNQIHTFHHVSVPLSMFSERLKRLKSIINQFAEDKILKT